MLATLPGLLRLLAWLLLAAALLLLTGFLLAAALLRVLVWVLALLTHRWLHRSLAHPQCGNAQERHGFLKACE
jgi:hypothetical protein